MIYVQPVENETNARNELCNFSRQYYYVIGNYYA